jgi:origin recognition complex subunit 5
MIFGESDSPVPPIFVSGQTSAGKTTLVKDLMKSLKLPHAFVDFIECGTQRQIFDAVLNQLNNHEPCAGNNYKDFTKCTDIPTFIEELQGLRRRTIASARKSGLQGSSSDFGDTQYIIFDNAECLRNFPTTLLTALLRLDELSGANLCTVLITSVLRDHFDHSLCNRHTLRVHFHDYSQEDMRHILLNESARILDAQALDAQCRDHIDPLRVQFARMLLSTFWGSCKSIEILRFFSSPPPPLPLPFAPCLAQVRQESQKP